MKSPFSSLPLFLILSFAFAQDKIITDKLVSVKEENGWNRIVTSSGISIALPPDWKLKMVTGKGLGQILDVASAAVDKKKYSASEKAEIAKEGGVRLMAVAPINKQLKFAPNLNIIRDTAVPAGGMAAEVKDLEGSLQSSGAKILAAMDVTLVSGSAKRISYVYQKTKFGPLFGVGYLISRGKWSYLLTFTLPGSMLIDLKRPVEKMANSFTVVSKL